MARGRLLNNFKPVRRYHRDCQCWSEHFNDECVGTTSTVKNSFGPAVLCERHFQEVMVCEQLLRGTYKTL